MKSFVEDLQNEIMLLRNTVTVLEQENRALKLSRPVFIFVGIVIGGLLAFLFWIPK